MMSFLYRKNSKPLEKNWLIVYNYNKFQREKMEGEHYEKTCF